LAEPAQELFQIITIGMYRGMREIITSQMADQIGKPAIR